MTLKKYYIKMNVIKRDGSVQSFDKNKIIRRIKFLSSDLEIDCDLLMENILKLISNNMTTRELDKFVSEEAYARIRYNLDYDKLASRLRWNDLHKSTSNNFNDKLEILKDRLNVDYYSFAKSNIEIIEKAINYDLDYNINYFGFMTLEKSYLLKVNKVTIERYQDLLMRIALYINIGKIKRAIKTYNALSENLYTHASTTLFNAGLCKSTLSSCYLLECGDDTLNICKKWEECGIISSCCGGICINITAIREENREIKSSGGHTEGIIPFIKTFQRIAKTINQGSRRNGSIAVSLEIWHPEIIRFLGLKLNTGDKESKSKNIFTSLFIPDIFFKRLDNYYNKNEITDQYWSLFSSLDYPELMDLYGEEFEEKYLELERYNKFVKQEKISTIWSAVLKSLVETGNPNMLSKDNINRVSNHMNIGTIRNTNLCCEIMEYHDQDEAAVCNLCSINLPKFVINCKFDFMKLKKLLKLIIYNMNRIIDIDQVLVSNNSLSQRPIGTGVQGFSDMIALLKLIWESRETSKINKLIFENIYYYSLFYSRKLAKKYGSYPYFNGSPLSKGIFQFELFLQYDEEKGKHVPVKIETTLDWDKLRGKILKNGVRNSLFVAPMPTASTAHMLGNTESCELVTSNIYTRKVEAGDFTVINKHMYQDLKQLDLWNKETVDKIISDDGSIQNIKEIPDHIKSKYLTCWEIKQKVLLDLAIDRTPFIDQSQSFNAFFSKPSTSALTSFYLYAWKKGMKTLSYYLRTKPVQGAVKFSIEKQVDKKRIECNDEVCLSCSS